MRFFVSDVESGARASKFARFPPKTGSTRLPCSEFRFLPRKACEFQPAELVAACHRFVTTRFLCKSAQNRAQFPSSFSAGFLAAGSPPRTRLNVRQPAEVVRQPAELVTTDVTAPQAPFFCAKSAPNGRVRGVRFSCRTVSGMPKPPNSQVFGGKTTTLLSFPVSGRKSGEFQPAEHVTACHRRCHRSLTRQPAELVTTDAAPSGSVFWCKTVESEGFRVGLQVGSLQIRRFSVESGLQTTTLLSFPLSGRKSGEFRLSPLRHRSPWGAASMGLQILVDPASSHMLVSKPKKVSGSIPPGSAPDHPSMVHEWCQETARRRPVGRYAPNPQAVIPTT